MLYNKIRKTLAIFAAGVAIVGVNSGAMGSMNSTAIGGDPLKFNGYAYGLTSPYAYLNSSKVNSSLVIGHETMRQSIIASANAINNHLEGIHDASAGRSNEGDAAGTATLADTGKNAGGRDSRFGTWVQVTNKNFGQKQEQYDYNGKLYQFVVGGDYRFHDNFLAGLALNCDYMDVKTDFNKGSSKALAVGLKPYVLAIVNKNFAVEGFLGYDYVNRKDTRTNLTQQKIASIGVGPNGGEVYGNAIGNSIDSKPKSQRLSAGIFARVAHKVNKVNLSARLGYIYGQDKYKSFSETGVGGLQYKGYTFKMQTLATKFSLGYSVSQHFMPYVHIDYAYDLKRANNLTFNDPQNGKTNSTNGVAILNQKSNRNAFGGGIGLKAKANECLCADLGFAYEKKGDITGNTTQLRFNYKF